MYTLSVMPFCRSVLNLVGLSMAVNELTFLEQFMTSVLPPILPCFLATEGFSMGCTSPIAIVIWHCWLIWLVWHFLEWPDGWEHDLGTWLVHTLLTTLMTAFLNNCQVNYHFFPSALECITTDPGTEYRGTKSTTKSGKKCKSWSSEWCEIDKASMSGVFTSFFFVLCQYEPSSYLCTHVCRMVQKGLIELIPEKQKAYKRFPKQNMACLWGFWKTTVKQLVSAILNVTLSF